jgi:hypothetical protein
MELRDYARTEASAFVDRLVGAAEALAHSARTESEQQLATLRAEMDGLRTEIEALTTRATAAESDIDAVIEAHRQVDGERLAIQKEKDKEAAARARAEEDLRGARELLERTRAEATRVSEALEREAAQNAIIQEERETLRGQLEQLAARVKTTQDEAEIAAQLLRDRFHEELRVARSEAEAISADRDAVRAEATTLRAETQKLKEEAQTVRALADQLRADLETAHGAMKRAEAETAKAHKEIEKAKKESEKVRADLEKARADAEALKTSGAGAADELKSLQDMLDASRKHHERHASTIKTLEAQLHDAETAASATLTGAVRALDSLSAAKSITELFGALVTQVATEMPRVALFRVKGNHLEGEDCAGVDDAGQIKKLVIPMNVDSVITRAVTGGALARADAEQLAQTRPPLGGSPASAFAVPVVFQGETLAVLYADSDKPATQAHSTFTLLLVRHAVVLLSRLTQELKLLKELREYATMLLQEAEQMFLADLEAARPAHESIRRLRDTIDCGRQLYAQRAALEGAAAAGIFDEQIALTINAQASPFAEALGAATAAQAQRNAS